MDTNTISVLSLWRLGLIGYLLGWGEVRRQVSGVEFHTLAVGSRVTLGGRPVLTCSGISLALDYYSKRILHSEHILSSP